MSNDSTILPTVGRVVWYHPAPKAGDTDFAQHYQAGTPYAAIVAYVWGEALVNLAVFDANGTPRSRSSVALIQEGESAPRDSEYCEWMPYQKGQARAQSATPTEKPAPREYTFDQFVEYGRNAGVARINGMPWSFKFHGHPVSHETDTLYLVNQESGLIAFDRGSIMVVKEDGTLHLRPGKQRRGGIDLDFGDALTHLRQGRRVARSGWNGKGMFVYHVPAASYPVQTGAAKEYFGEGAMVPYSAYFALKGVDGAVSTWVPSINDCLAEDWMVVA
ncbi:hypothetical protein D3C86_1087070 [compost metagenome]